MVVIKVYGYVINCQIVTYLLYVCCEQAMGSFSSLAPSDQYTFNYCGQISRVIHHICKRLINASPNYTLPPWKPHFHPENVYTVLLYSDPL